MQRPKTVPSEVIPGPLMEKYSELMTKAPETTRTLRLSTLAQRDTSSLSFGMYKQIRTGDQQTMQFVL